MRTRKAELGEIDLQWGCHQGEVLDLGWPIWAAPNWGKGPQVLYNGLSQGEGRKAILSPGYIWQCLKRIFLAPTIGGGGVGALLTSSGWRPGTPPLNILQCTRQPPTTKSHPAPNVNTAEIEKACRQSRRHWPWAALARTEPWTGPHGYWQFPLRGAAVSFQ